MQELVKVMKAVSDPSRIKILKILGHCPQLCVCELNSLLCLAQPTVSRHLKILEAARLVDGQKDGTWVHYQLTTGKDSEYARTLLAHLKDWLVDDPDITKLQQQALQVNRETACNMQKQG